VIKGSGWGRGVVLDVTSFISAQEFIAAQNRHEEPEDPFARQCFVEVVQSLIFQPVVWVVHPTLLLPSHSDFGSEPSLLQELFRADAVRPLRLGEMEAGRLRAAEDLALDQLETNGVETLLRFIQQVVECDHAQRELGKGLPLADRLVAWTSFQARRVRHVPGHHSVRIHTPDGIEEDPFGDWSRHTARAVRGRLREVAGDEDAKYLITTLARALRYQARAAIRRIPYQPHPLRRDFALTFALADQGVESDNVFRLVQAVRGIYASMSEAAGETGTHRLQLLELELPLLGGRLWGQEDIGRMDDHAWVRLVAERISEYRRRAADLRQAIDRCVAEEDYLRIDRDLAEVKQQLLERLGLKGVDLAPLEKELVQSVASVAESAPGVPKVGGVWLGIRSLGRRLTFSGRDYQKFLYKEFLEAWKRSGN